MWTIKDAKNGDILIRKGFRGYTLGSIFMFKGIEDGLIKYHCYYNIAQRSFSVNSDDYRFHLGYVDNEEDYRPATDDEKVLLLDVMNDYYYEFDDESGEFYSTDDRKIGKPQIETEDYEFGILHITHLNDLQRNIISDLVKSWNK